MNLAFNLLYMFELVNSNLYCVSSPCNSCQQGFAYKSISCVSLCPHGFEVSGNKCIQSLSDLTLFDLEFNSFTSLTATCIDRFCHPYGISFIDSNKSSPIPTIDKGFYFEPTSGLSSSKSWIPAPDFSLAIYARIFSPGTIFYISKEDKTYFSVVADQMELKITLFLTNLNEIGTYTELKKEYNYYWVQIRIYTAQFDKIIKIYSSLGYFYFNDYEFRAQISNLQFIFGSLNSTGFKGFIYKSNSENNSKYFIYYSYPINCRTTSPLYYGTCNNCSPNCNSWPICNDNDCNYCYSNKCLYCTGLGPEDCAICSNPELDMCLEPLNCIEGKTFNCSNCAENHTIVDGLCILNVTLPPVLSIKFDQFAQFYGDLFKNGKNETTYAPFNNPEDDDPTPLYLRGLYFYNNQYITTNEELTFNISFSVFLWYKSGYISTLIHSSNFGIFNGADSFVKLSNSVGSKEFSIPKRCFITSWNLIGMVVEYTNKVSNLYFICNSSITEKISINGYFFYSNKTFLTIKVGTTTNFLVYQLVVLQYAELLFTDKINICGKGIDASCLSILANDTYLNKNYNNRYLCEAGCTRGCRYWGTCNPCQNIMCRTCENYDGTCEIDQNYNPCMDGFELSADRTSCCHSNCATCKGPQATDCLSCKPGFFRLVSECLEVCPLGFIPNLVICTLKNNILISIDFSMILNNFTTSNDIRFDTGNDSMFYPNPGSYDPIPAKNRGFYFTGTSYLMSDPILLPFNCTYSLWVRIIEPGVLIEKSNLLIGAELSVSYLNNSFFMPRLNDFWQLVSFSKKVHSKNLVLYINQNNTQKNNVFDYSFELEENSRLYIGNSIKGFKGFIWKFMIFNNLTTITLNICSPNKITDCVVNCNFEEFFNGTHCNACNQSCGFGCVRSSDCNLCDDTKCSKCNNFLSGCEECVENAIFSNECVCDSGFYWNLGTLKCEGCQDRCLQCENNLVCNTCFDSFILFNNTCTCKSHEFIIGNNCSQCHEACNQCSGPTETECLSCNEPLFLINSSCECPNFYFKENNSCSDCLLNCESCKNYTHCEKCENNLTFIEDKCKCLDGQYRDGNYCINCDQSCLNCYEADYYQCSSCDKAELMGICYEECPLGYNLTGQTCLVNDLKTIDFKFTSVMSSYLDEKSLITAETCDTINQVLIEVINRGIFIKNSCMKLQNNQSLILVSPTFYSAFWLRISEDSPLLSLQTNENFNFEIIRSVQGIISNIMVSGAKSRINMKENIELKTWTHLIIGIKYAHGSNLVVAINNLSSKIKYISEKPYKDDPYSVLYIGSTTNFSEFYSGFLYSFQLFTDMPGQDDILLYSCFQATGLNCLLNCEINEFFLNRCEPCPEYCTPTCISFTRCDDCGKNCLNCNKSDKSECFKCEKGYELVDKECKECKDGTYYNESLENCADCGSNCLICNKFDKNICIKCEKGYILANDHCEACRNGTYNNEILNTCENCGQLCEKCETFEKCLQCEGNSSLINNTCECNSGFVKKNGCTKDYFYASLTVSFSNEINIYFSEPLLKDLDKNSISVKVNKKVIAFEISKKDLVHFLIVFKSEFQQNDDKNYHATVLFLKDIYSVYKSQLSTNTYKVKLYAEISSEFESQIPKSYSKSLVSSALAASALTSIFFLDPSTIFNLMNMIELFSYVLLYDINIHESLTGFIKDLNSKIQFPNFFQLFIPINSKTPEKYSRLSYESSLFMLNAGMSLVLLLFIHLLYGLVLFLANLRNEKVKTIFIFFKHHFKYAIFIRFYIQTCFQISICCLISLNYSFLSSFINILDFSICILLTIFQVLAFIKILIIVRKASSIETNERNKFIQIYSTIFYEFKSLEIHNCLFYVIFVLRRLILAIFIVEGSSPILQLTISIVLSLINFVYIIVVRPFKDSLYQLFNLVNELIILSYYGYFLSTFIRNFKKPLIEQSAFAVKLILITLGINMLYNVSKLFLNIFKFIKSKVYRKKEKVFPMNEMPTSVFQHTKKNEEIMNIR